MCPNSLHRKETRSTTADTLSNYTKLFIFNCTFWSGCHWWLWPRMWTWGLATQSVGREGLFSTQGWFLGEAGQWWWSSNPLKGALLGITVVNAWKSHFFWFWMLHLSETRIRKLYRGSWISLVPNRGNCETLGKLLNLLFPSSVRQQSLFHLF